MSKNRELEEIIKRFGQFKSWEEKYKFIIDLGKTIKKMPDEHKLEQNIVKGCQSRVWLWAVANPNQTVHFYADSDAMIVKGLIAIILSAYQDRAPTEIFQSQDEFIDTLDLKQHLSASRANGLGAMLKQIKLYAYALHAKSGGLNV